MKQKLFITGGKPLRGEVMVSGAKNAATKMMIASLLTTEPVILDNCPRIGDVEIAAEILKKIGAKVEFSGSTVRLHTPKIKSTTVGKLSFANRLPILAISPLLARAGQAKVPIVGGDKIGARPVDFHLKALHQMGIDVKITGSIYAATCKKPHGTAIALSYPSVGATENIIFAGVLASGRTYISGAAIEPEILDLIKMLQQMGAIIEFRADRTIIIDGVDSLRGVHYTIMPDRLEAASYGLMAIATKGDILVKNARQEDLITFLNTIRRLGADYFIEANGIRFKRTTKPLIGIELETDTHPGFATDWQQPLTVLLTQAKGISVVHETVYEDRFGYTTALNNMGAKIGVFSKCLGELPCRFKDKLQKHSAIIDGPTKLKGTKIEIPDIRAGMAHVLAALIAEDRSEILGIEHLLRGYENLSAKLTSIGADFKIQNIKTR